MNKPAIIFLHKGNPGYLKFALKNAMISNPDSEIFLLGDESNSSIKLSRGGHYNICDYFESAKSFEKIYIYQSKNSYEFELFCFQRWFVLKDFVETNNINCFIACDSDVLIYDDLSKYFEYDNWQNDFLNVVDRNGPQCVYFTKESINNFCNYIISEYTDLEKKERLNKVWLRNLELNLPGGNCDMTMFSDYGIDFPGKLKNIYGVQNLSKNNCFFYDASNYESFNKSLFKHCVIRHMTIAKMKFKKHIPYIWGVDGRLYKSPIIHFQGKYKALMCKYSYANSFFKLFDTFIFYFHALNRKVNQIF